MKQSSKDFFKNEDDRNDFFISIPVIAIAAVFILWQWGNSNNSEIYYAPVIEEAEKDKNLFSADISKSNKPPLSVYLEEVKEQRITPNLLTKSPRIVPNSGAISSAEPPNIVQLIEEDKVIVNKSLIKDNDLVSPRINLVKEFNSEIVLEKVNEGTLPVSEESDDTKTVTHVGTNLNCSIAVGLYKEDQNLKKMHHKLVQNGYEAILIPLKNSTKVAIKIPCLKKSSLRILQEIRADYAQDAFIE